ncbi:MAG: hypothetical protein HW380_2819 [Magnetococcales bacterium]|nr:hypothetical protein [Magnetococcales bacterium]HIJ84202.1 PEGA domain-containing protein [Magnetococcales bacterium]
MPIPSFMAILVMMFMAPAMAQDDKTTETTLLVKVIPRGAEVLVNGVPMGKAPFLIKKPPLGQISLRARHMGYRSLTRNFEVIANKNNVTVFILANRSGNLGSQTGTLIIESEPQGATLSLDGAPLGKSPMRAESVGEGEHRITAIFPGLGEKTAVVQAIASEAIQVHIPWAEPMPKNFRLDITPKEAKVHFLNHPQPYQPGMPLPKGRYLLRASHPDHVTTDIAVDMGDKDFHSWVTLQKTIPVPSPPAQNPQASKPAEPAPGK